MKRKQRPNTSQPQKRKQSLGAVDVRCMTLAGYLDPKLRTNREDLRQISRVKAVLAKRSREANEASRVLNASSGAPLPASTSAQDVGSTFDHTHARSTTSAQLSQSLRRAHMTSASASGQPRSRRNVASANQSAERGNHYWDQVIATRKAESSTYLRDPLDSDPMSRAVANQLKLRRKRSADAEESVEPPLEVALKELDARWGLPSNNVGHGDGRREARDQRAYAEKERTRAQTSMEVPFHSALPKRGPAATDPDLPQAPRRPSTALDPVFSSEVRTPDIIRRPSSSLDQRTAPHAQGNTSRPSSALGSATPITTGNPREVKRTLAKLMSTLPTPSESALARALNVPLESITHNEVFRQNHAQQQGSNTSTDGSGDGGGATKDTSMLSDAERLARIQQREAEDIYADLPQQLEAYRRRRESDFAMAVAIGTADKNAPPIPPIGSLSGSVGADLGLPSRKASTSVAAHRSSLLPGATPPLPLSPVSAVASDPEPDITTTTPEETTPNLQATEVIGSRFHHEYASSFTPAGKVFAMAPESEIQYIARPLSSNGVPRSQQLLAMRQLVADEAKQHGEVDDIKNEEDSSAMPRGIGEPAGDVSPAKTRTSRSPQRSRNTARGASNSSASRTPSPAARVSDSELYESPPVLRDGERRLLALLERAPVHDVEEEEAAQDAAVGGADEGPSLLDGSMLSQATFSKPPPSVAQGGLQAEVTFVDFTSELSATLSPPRQPKVTEEESQHALAGIGDLLRERRSGRGRPPTRPATANDLMSASTLATPPQKKKTIARDTSRRSPMDNMYRFCTAVPLVRPEVRSQREELSRMLYGDDSLWRDPNSVLGTPPLTESQFTVNSSVTIGSTPTTSPSLGFSTAPSAKSSVSERVLHCLNNLTERFTLSRRAVSLSPDEDDTGVRDVKRRQDLDRRLSEGSELDSGMMTPVEVNLVDLDNIVTESTITVEARGGENDIFRDVRSRHASIAPPVGEYQLPSAMSPGEDLAQPPSNLGSFSAATSPLVPPAMSEGFPQGDKLPPSEASEGIRTPEVSFALAPAVSKPFSDPPLDGAAADDNTLVPSSSIHQPPRPMPSFTSITTVTPASPRPDVQSDDGTVKDETPVPGTTPSDDGNAESKSQHSKSRRRSSSQAGGKHGRRRSTIKSPIDEGLSTRSPLLSSRGDPDQSFASGSVSPTASQGSRRRSVSRNSIVQDADAVKLERVIEDRVRVAVIVGISSYHDSRLPYDDQPFVDAMDLFDILSGMGFHCVLLSDRSEDPDMKPTRENILTAISRETAVCTSANCLSLVYFIGAGFVGPLKDAKQAPRRRSSASVGGNKKKSLVVSHVMLPQDVSYTDLTKSTTLTVADLEVCSGVGGEKNLVIVDASSVSGIGPCRATDCGGFASVGGRKSIGGELDVTYGLKQRLLMTLYMKRALQGYATRDSRITTNSLNHYVKSRLDKLGATTSSSSSTFMVGNLIIATSRELELSRHMIKKHKSKLHTTPAKFHVRLVPIRNQDPFSVEFVREMKEKFTESLHKDDFEVPRGEFECYARSPSRLLHLFMRSTRTEKLLANDGALLEHDRECHASLIKELDDAELKYALTLQNRMTPCGLIKVGPRAPQQAISKLLYRLGSTSARHRRGYLGDVVESTLRLQGEPVHEVGLEVTLSFLTNEYVAWKMERALRLGSLSHDFITVSMRVATMNPEDLVRERAASRIQSLIKGIRLRQVFGRTLDIQTQEKHARIKVFGECEDELRELQLKAFSRVREICVGRHYESFSDLRQWEKEEILLFYKECMRSWGDVEQISRKKLINLLGERDDVIREELGTRLMHQSYGLSWLVFARQYTKTVMTEAGKRSQILSEEMQQFLKLRSTFQRQKAFGLF